MRHARRAHRVAAPQNSGVSPRSSGCGADGRAGRPGSPTRPRPRTGSAGGGCRSTTSGWSRSGFRRRCRRSGPRACRPRPGSRFTLLIRTIGWRAKPSPRCSPRSAGGRSQPRSHARRGTGEHAFAHDRRPAALHALVVPAVAAERAGVGGVRGHAHVLRAEPEAAGVRGHEARAGIGGLAAEHPVQLHRMADRLVHLEGELLAGQDERGRPRGAGGAGRSATASEATAAPAPAGPARGTARGRLRHVAAVRRRIRAELALARPPPRPRARRRTR